MEHQGTDQVPATGSSPHSEEIALSIAPEQLESFFPMLQRGVTVRAELGSPLRELLCRQLGIPADYVEGRITTIFLDNHPVDDLDRSLIREGSRVTLSAAMPGLVGATMRRSGFYAALRQGISHAETAGAAGAGLGTVRLKLFNLLLPELAPLVLARGILLTKDELERLACRLGGGSVLASAPAAGAAGDTVLLRVTVNAEGGGDQIGGRFKAVTDNL